MLETSTPASERCSIVLPELKFTAFFRQPGIMMSKITSFDSRSELRKLPSYCFYRITHALKRGNVRECPFAG